MKRYRLTKSGVCDCMLPDDNGPWVEYEEAEQARREVSSLVAKWLATRSPVLHEEYLEEFKTELEE